MNPKMVDWSKIESLEEYAISLYNARYWLTDITNCTIKAMHAGFLAQEETILASGIVDQSRKLMAFYTHQLNLVLERIPNTEKMEQIKNQLQEKKNEQQT